MTFRSLQNYISDKHETTTLIYCYKMASQRHSWQEEVSPVGFVWLSSCGKHIWQ